MKFTEVTYYFLVFDTSKPVVTISKLRTFSCNLWIYLCSSMQSFNHENPENRECFQILVLPPGCLTLQRWLTLLVKFSFVMSNFDTIM